MRHPHRCQSYCFLLPTRCNSTPSRRGGSACGDWTSPYTHNQLVLGEASMPSCTPMDDIYWAALATDSVPATSVYSLSVLWKPWSQQPDVSTKAIVITTQIQTCWHPSFVMLFIFWFANMLIYLYSSPLLFVSSSK